MMDSYFNENSTQKPAKIGQMGPRVDPNPNERLRKLNLRPEIELSREKMNNFSKIFEFFSDLKAFSSRNIIEYLRILEMQSQKGSIDLHCLTKVKLVLLGWSSMQSDFSQRLNLDLQVIDQSIKAVQAKQDKKLWNEFAGACEKEMAAISQIQKEITLLNGSLPKETEEFFKRVGFLERGIFLARQNQLRVAGAQRTNSGSSERDPKLKEQKIELEERKENHEEKRAREGERTIEGEKQGQRKGSDPRRPESPKAEHNEGIKAKMGPGKFQSSAGQDPQTSQAQREDSKPSSQTEVPLSQSKEKPRISGNLGENQGKSTLHKAGKVGLASPKKSNLAH